YPGCSGQPRAEIAPTHAPLTVQQIVPPGGVIALFAAEVEVGPATERVGVQKSGVAPGAGTGQCQGHGEQTGSRASPTTDHRDGGCGTPARHGGLGEQRGEFGLVTREVKNARLTGCCVRGSTAHDDKTSMRGWVRVA